MRVISKLFRGKFLDGLKQAFTEGRIRTSRDIEQAGGLCAFNALLSRLYAQQWVVYCKPPLIGTESVVAYFACYAYRVAISNSRIATIDKDRVTIRYRDRSKEGGIRSLSLAGEEFVRRFLLHILADRFVKIRYYGLMSNRLRKKKLGICRSLLEGADVDQPQVQPEPWQDLLKRITGFDVRQCPQCGLGTMVVVNRLLPHSGGVPP